MSLPLPGAWIEIASTLIISSISSRSLYRERGLKYNCTYIAFHCAGSLPLPGAWIEIIRPKDRQVLLCRSLYRERGLKFCHCLKLCENFCRSLYRERGLKYQPLFMV